MPYIVDNAIIMAAGLSSRMGMNHKPKALLEINGEVLIERQICQLQEAGISDVIIVIGNKKEQFYYLEEKFNVRLIENPEYATRNNNGSIYAARKYIRNSYICSCDNYFTVNPFEKQVVESYYSVIYSEGYTDEWCTEIDSKGYISSVTISGTRMYYMIGHAFWSIDFSQKFLKILTRDYDKPETRNLLWEGIYANNLDILKMVLKKYNTGDIFEVDTPDDFVSTTKKILEKVK